ncbi:hypothetical protein H4R18_001936 [Coemansia javaensis]|uniref:Uncharacterized protein n=1 Tax=Coemansia javaensis TaxID=2761396 RepID=A0A9W8HDN7_9FUNG|nr:hypothetical protein H4R18_001936 [Coemansia javaensis]
MYTQEDRDAAAAAREWVERVFETRIVSFNEWCHLHRVMTNNREWIEVCEPLLYGVGVINIALGGSVLAPVSNISDIMRAGYRRSARYLVVHASSGPLGADSGELYHDLGRHVRDFAAMPLRTAVVPRPPTFLLGSLGRTIEIALCAMPNLQGVLISRLPNGERNFVPGADHRYISYCATIGDLPRQGGASPRCIELSDDSDVSVGSQLTDISQMYDSATLSIAAGRDVRFELSEDELRQMRLERRLLAGALADLCRLPVPRELLRMMGERVQRPGQPCRHAMPGRATMHVRRHLHFSPSMPFVLASGAVREYDWCRIVMDEDLGSIKQE